MKLRNIIFYVKDINSSVEFYKQLGFRIAQDFGKFVSFSTENERIFFSIMESDDSEKVPGKQVCAFWCKNINNLYDKFKKLNLKIATELYKTSFGETFAIRDLDGNKIEFVEE